MSGTGGKDFDWPHFDCSRGTRQSGSADGSEGEATPDPLHDRDVLLELPGSSQHQFRSVADEQRSPPDGKDLWHGSGNSVCGLYGIGDSKQPDTPPSRGETVAGADHD